jgi:hypothetical protein
MTYMQIVGRKANLVDFALFLESSGVKEVLKDTFIVASFQILTETPTILLQTGTWDFGIFCTAESIDTLVHRDIVFVNLAHKFNGHSSVFCQILRNKRCVGLAVVASAFATRGIEGLAEIAQYLSAAAIGLVLTELYHGTQHVMQPLLLLPAAFAVVDHFSQRPRIGVLVV